MADEQVRGAESQQPALPPAGLTTGKPVGDREYLDRFQELFSILTVTKTPAGDHVKYFDAFARWVEKERARGSLFALEEIFAKAGLAREEQLAALYLLMVTSLPGERSMEAIIDFISPGGSVAEKLQLSGIFKTARPLLSSGLVKQVGKPRFKREVSTPLEIEYCLTEQLVGAVSGALEGGELELDWLDRKERVKKGGRRPTPKLPGTVTEPAYTIDDVILPAAARDRVRFLLESGRNLAFAELGVFDTIRRGKGMTFLFYGPPGTGKSMLAEGIAHELGKSLLTVEIPKIMSKWQGETDKAIHTLFTGAVENDLVILFDEADSLLYNRSYAHQEHDIRFVNDMLTELERFEGVAILTTNMDTLLDPALERRVSLKVRFELPPNELQEKIWRAHIPPKIKLRKEVDFGKLAKQYDFSGGNIRNAVLNAIRTMVLAKRKTLSMADLVAGAELERDGMFAQRNKGVRVGGFAACDEAVAYG